MAEENAGNQPEMNVGLSAIRERHRGHSVEDRTVPPQTGSPWRGLILGIVGVVILSIVTPYADAYMESSSLSATYLPTGVVLLFLLILGMNTLLRYTRFPFTQRELMLAYVTMLVPSAMPADGWSLRLVPLLIELDYYATPVNEWKILHGSNIPHWMTPHGNEVVTWFFTGRPRGARIPWEPWVRPLAIWCVLAAGLYLIMLSFSIAFRKRWMDAERLQFPLAQVPLTIMGDDPAPSWVSSFFRQPLLWAGMAVPFFFHTINGLNLYFPAIPSIRLTDIFFSTIFAGSQFITEPPFAEWAGVRLNFYWSIIGISYLLRSEVSLSVWAFEWFYNFEMIVFQWSGYGNGQFEWSPLHTFGYSLMARYQRAGAIAAASIAYFVASRKEIGEMVRAAFGMRTTRYRGGEAAIPWWSFWAFVVGMTIYFTWTAATGMKTIAAVVLLAFFLGIAITTARIVAASGLLWVYDFFVPMHGLTVLVGTARIDPKSFTNVGYVDFVALNNRAVIMPQILDGMKISRQTGIRQSHFFLGIVLGTVVATVVSMATVLWLGYTYGGANMTDFMFRGGGEWLFNRVAGFQRYRVYTNWTVIGCMSAGAAFMMSLLYLHRTYLWWPLYPLGFIIGGSVASGQMWFPVMLGWLAKAIIVRFAGAGAYDRFKATALGLVLGEFLCVGMWMAIDAATGLTLHRVFPVWTPQ
ncbi:MAG TPA: hypothetical protein PLM66_01340 [Candidatus Latescibacteria bacterium]|nr:hypothetical protein [Candidatus Latescibacterota bacterium]